MTNPEKKVAEVKAELYPLSKAEFEDLYDKAWDCGWVYGKFFQELYDEYLVNWIYFVDYLDVLKELNNDSRKYKRIKINDTDYAIMEFKKDMHGKVVKPVLIEAKDFYLELFLEKVTEEKLNEVVKKQEIINNVEILIGEAPPYWKGNADNEDKSYFYNPSQIHNSPWLNGPANWKSSVNKFMPKKKEKVEIKIEKLKLLAYKKVVLIDFLPFPIIQNTKVRQNITGGFSYLLSNYFIDKYNEITSYINNSQEEIINFKHGFVATTYTSLQFIFDNSINDEAKSKSFREKILESPIIGVKIGELQFGYKDEMIKVSALISTKKKSGETKVEYKPLFKFIYELYTKNKFNSSHEDIERIIDDLNSFGSLMKCPIFMVEGGSVNMSESFFNSIDRLLGEKEIEKINSDLIESNN